MPKVMMSIESSEGMPTLQDISAKYALADDEIDNDFGVVELDPDNSVYLILVEQSATPKIVSNDIWKVQGTYSNPTIATLDSE